MLGLDSSLSLAIRGHRFGLKLVHHDLTVAPRATACLVCYSSTDLHTLETRRWGLLQTKFYRHVDYLGKRKMVVVFQRPVAVRRHRLSDTDNMQAGLVSSEAFYGTLVFKVFLQLLNIRL